MEPIEILMAEHRRIERTLDALLARAAAIGRGEDGEAARKDVARFAAVFAGYADAFHHAKEENLLFAAMVESGFPRDGGPIAVMLHDHDEGRRAVAALRGVGAGAGPLVPGERAAVAETADFFAAMLRAHIRKEDRILYPMAESHLPPDAAERLAAAFARFEAERGAEGERLAAEAERLIAAFAPEPGDREEPDPTPGHGCGGCGHHH